MSRSPRCRISILSLLVVLFSACTGPTTPPPQPAPITVPPAASAPTSRVDQLLARMTLEQKVGQVMVSGFDATAYDSKLREMIEKYQVGGVIWFARNVASPT